MKTKFSKEESAWQSMAETLGACVGKEPPAFKRGVISDAHARADHYRTLVAEYLKVLVAQVKVEPPKKRGRPKGKK